MSTSTRSWSAPWLRQMWSQWRANRRAASVRVGREASATLWNQEDLPGRLPSLQVDVRLAGLGERIARPDSYVQLARRDEVEHRARTFVQLLRRPRVGPD